MRVGGQEISAGTRFGPIEMTELISLNDRWWGRRLLGVLTVLAGAGCATQPDYQAPALATAPAWSEGAAAAGDSQGPQAWWRLLQDPAVDMLVEAALNDNPSLAEAMARVDEARASLGIDSAARLPSLTANAAFSRATQLQSNGAADAVTPLASASSAGVNLAWELDWSGRVRSAVEASRRRLDARDAQAQGVRLDLVAQVATTALGLRACGYGLAVQREDVLSRERVLQLTRARVDAGSLAPAEEARARSSLALSRTVAAARQEECDRQVNALAVLSGSPAAEVRALLPEPRVMVDETFVLAAPPEVGLALPATVLRQHLSVVAAERDAAAAWSDIAVARAERLPRLDLGAALAGQWLRVGGTALDYTSRLLTVGLAAPLFDGGRGRGTVEAAEARYRAATARLSQAVRQGWREVEDALTGIESSKVREASAGESVLASRRLLAATEAQWRAGSLSLFELEDARRLYSEARNSEVAAGRDRGQSWVALVRAAGNAISLNPNTHGDPHATPLD